MAGWQGGGEAVGRKLRLVSTVALAGLLTNGCDAGSQPQGPELPGSYQLAAALELAPPALLKAEPNAASPAVRESPRAVAAADLPPAAQTRPAQLIAPGLAAESPIPMQPQAPLAAVAAIELPEPSAADGAAPPIEAATQPATDLAIPAPAPALTDAGPGTGELAYIPQITDSDRAAYIAQVDVAPADQRLAVRAGEAVLGAVAFQVEGGMVSVHIGQVLDLFQGRMEPAQFAALRGSPAADQFVSLERLQAAGIALTYNAAYDELVLDPARG